MPGGAMASRLQAINIDGQTIWAEVNDIEIPADVTVASKRAAMAGKTAKTSAAGAGLVVDSITKVDIARTLAAIVGPVHAAFDALGAFKPEEASVELSLGLKGEVGVFVAKSEANASLKVTVKWKFPATKPAPG